MHLDAIFAAGALPFLVESFRSDLWELQEQMARAPRGLAAGSQQIKDAICAAGALPLLVECLRSGQLGLQQQATAALRSLTAGSQQNTEAMYAAGALPALHALPQNFREAAIATVRLLTPSL